SQQRVLAPDGRCKAFSAQADGAGWSEGVAVLVLERYSAARRDGHRVLGVIRGCAVNQDGASNGLTAPSGPAQEDVIRRALADAGLRGDEVDAVEAHGTGTRLGDPIEARALAAVYGSDRVPGNALWLGSVKSNIGHTQAAAGAVGVVKMLLALRHGVLPRTLHIDQATSHVDWSAGTVRLLVDAVDWRPRDRPRRAGVSAFGISGTNAHVILEEPPADDPPPAATGREHPPVPWVLSAASPQALRATAARLRAAVDGMRAEDVGYTLARTRARLRYRAVALPDADGDHRPALDALATGTDSPDAVSGEAGAVGRTVFVFPGQGAQWAGMARALLATAPAFAATIAACAEAFAPHLDWSLPDVLRGAPSAPSLDRVDVVQPALFSVMVALATLWRSHGVYPDAVIGHSQGEVAAAYVAGALSLPDAARIVAVRSRLLRTLAGRGAMASVPLPAHQVAGRLRPAAGRVSVAAVNGPRTTVISGAPDAVAELVAMLHAEHVPARPVPIEVAAHCAQVDELIPRLQQALAGITPRTGAVPFFSTVDGEWLDTAGLTAGYWCRNLRETVNFHPATRNLATQKYRYFIEVSPHPVLTTAMEQTLDDLPDGGIAIATLHSDDGGLPRFLRALAQAEVCGAAVDPTAVFPTGTARRVDLPTYPFQHSRFWAPTATWTPPASTGENSPVPAPVAGLNSEQTAAALLALVRTQAAAVTGFPDGQHIDAARTLQEQGFSSLAITELRARLSRATGLRLPAALTLDHPTPAALSRYLAQHLQPSPRPPAPGQSPESGNLESLLRQASAGGRIVAGLEMLKAASLIRPQFTATEPPEVQPVPVAHGPGRPMLVCLASLTPLSSPTEYASWRNTFDEIRDVVALPQPGFAQAQPLPRDLDALLAAHSAAVTRIAGSNPYLLCGHSSGGWIAHATAGYLAGHGRPPTGVVLLDSYWPDASFHQHVLPKVLSHLIDAADPDLGTARLTATGGYLRIMADWTPTRLDMPTLHIQARDPMLPGLPPPRWHLPHDAAVVDGTHLTMTTGHDDQVTKVVEEWINH
ncbi:MAG: hypothetical protein QOE61_5151, partial [Micromonosporaceae bacterium]|nr:hypothetical protein [Micromonosporaceae bacterium]